MADELGLMVRDKGVFTKAVQRLAFVQNCGYSHPCPATAVGMMLVPAGARAGI